MPDLVFIQRSRLGRSIFALGGEFLEITSHLFGHKSEARIAIRSISSNYDLGARRLQVMIVLPLLLAMGCFVAAFMMLTGSLWPQMLAMYAGWFGFVFLLLCLRFVRRVEYFTFRDQWNRPLFSILREPEQAAECDAFVRALLDRIEQMEVGSVADDISNAPLPSISAVRLPHDEGLNRPPKNRWILSIVAGAVSTAFPVVTYSFVASPGALAVVVGCSTGGFIWAALSFKEKEEKRCWALVGIALSVVPIVFYEF